MRISDWSSDVCSSDLGERQQLIRHGEGARDVAAGNHELAAEPEGVSEGRGMSGPPRPGDRRAYMSLRPVRVAMRDRKSVVSGKRVSVRVDPGGRRIIKKKRAEQTSIM